MSPPNPAPSERRRRIPFTVDTTIILLLLSYRVLNSFSIKTFFQPDEYYQSLEPAWDLVLGNGWITWEWHNHLRSIAHPLLFTPVYHLITFLSPYLPASTTSSLLSASPKLLQAVFATLGDFATAKLAGRLYGPGAGWTALALSTGSAWNWFCSTRTFVNSLEMVVTAVAMSWWPFEGAGEGTGVGEASALGAAAVACVLRPTNALIWAVLGGFRVAYVKGWKRKVSLMLKAVVIGTTVFGLSALLDSWYYQRWTFPPYHFLRYNLIHSLSTFYGSSPSHYYLTQALPLLLTSFLPITLFALFTSLLASPVRSPSFQLAATVTLVTAVYSCITHKEFRFLYPLLPALHVLAARSLHITIRDKALRKKVLAAMVAINIPIALYAGMVHQRGVVDVVNHLAAVDAQEVGFLMPCHSVPWGAAVGKSVPGWWALTCEPPVGLTLEEREGYRDEADRFYDDFNGFWEKEVEGVGRAGIERLVVFGEAEKRVGEKLGDEYRVCWRGFNSQVHDDWRRRGEVVVFCRGDVGNEKRKEGEGRDKEL